MLPFVIGGGIMIALAFLLDQIWVFLKINCHNLVLTMKLLLNSKQLVALLLASCFQYLQVTLLTLSLKTRFGIRFRSWCYCFSGAAFGGVPFASGGKATLAPCLAYLLVSLELLLVVSLQVVIILVLRKLLAGIPRALEGSVLSYSCHFLVYLLLVS